MKSPTVGLRKSNQKLRSFFVKQDTVTSKGAPFCASLTVTSVVFRTNLLATFLFQIFDQGLITVEISEFPIIIIKISHSNLF